MLRRHILRAPSDSLQRPVAAPPHRPGTPEGVLRVGRCFLPWASLPHDACRSGGPVACGASSPAACHVRGLGTSIAASTTTPAEALRPPSVHGLLPSRRSPRVRSDSLSGVPALLPLLASIRLAPIGACGRDRLQGLAPGRELVRSVVPLRARRVDASLGFFPSERSPPPSSRALHGFAPAPPPRVGRDDVPTRLRLEVLRNGGIGIAPLGAAGSPGICHLSTAAAPSKGRSGRRAHGFASRPEACTRPEPIYVSSRPTRPRCDPRPGAAVLR